MDRTGKSDKAPRLNHIRASKFLAEWNFDHAAPLSARGFDFISCQAGAMRDQSHPNDVERSDADPRLIAAIAAGAGIFLIAVPFIVLGGYPDILKLGAIAEAPQPPAPRLQISPQADLGRLNASENSQLGSFGWVDRDQQIARMPIEQAMKLLAERGLSGWPSPPAKPAQR
jgi:hypothetical protein